MQNKNNAENNFPHYNNILVAATCTQQQAILIRIKNEPLCVIVY